MPDLCLSVDTWIAPYYGSVIPAAILTTFQVLLFFHSSYNELTLKNDARFRSARVTRILYIILQLLAIYLLVCYILWMVIEPDTLSLQNTINAYCKLLVYIPIFVPGWYYNLYLIMILFRLEKSFKGTPFGLSRCSKYMLRISIMVIPIVASVTLSMDADIPVCLSKWSPRDIPNDRAICMIPTEEMIAFKYGPIVGCTLWTCSLSLLFAVMFTVKLRRILKMARTSSPKMHGQAEQLNVNLMNVILRNNLLTAIGTLSTFLGGFSTLYCLLYSLCCDTCFYTCNFD